MNAQSTLKLVGVVLLAGVIAACSSTSRQTVIKAKTQSILEGKTVYLTVKSDFEDPPPNHKAVASQLLKRLSSRLVYDKIFGTVVPVVDKADYRVDVRILGVRETSVASRVMLTFMSPRSNVTARVEVRKRAPAELITSFRVVGYGAKNWLSSEGYGTDDPVRKVVDQVVFNLR